jgi:hypothetical protein
MGGIFKNPLEKLGKPGSKHRFVFDVGCSVLYPYYSTNSISPGRFPLLRHDGCHSSDQ